MLRLLISALALVAIARANCLSTEISLFTGIAFNGADLSGLSASGTYQLSSIPVCQAAFSAGPSGSYNSCCAAGTFDVIRDFGGNLSVVIKSAWAELEAADDNNFGIPAGQGPEAQLTNDIVNALKKFYSAFLKDYSSCLNTYRDYLEGVLCSLCRADFFPNVATFDSTTNSITFNFAPTTCSSLVTACGPTIQDIIDLEANLLTIIGAYLNQSGLGSDISALNGSFNFLQGVPGATTADQIQYFICNAQVAGFSEASLVDFGALESSLVGALGGLKRRDIVKRIRNVFARAQHSQHQTSLRGTGTEASAGSGSVSNSYNGNYDPVAAGTQMNYISSPTGTAASLIVSLAATFATVAVLLF